MQAAPATEVSEEFIKGMRDRMAVSYYKYGPVKDAYPFKVDALASLQRRLREYENTGNTEFLMDAANFCMIEFMHPAKVDAHYRPTDSDESPGRTSVSSGFPHRKRTMRYEQNNLGNISRIIFRLWC